MTKSPFARTVRSKTLQLGFLSALFIFLMHAWAANWDSYRQMAFDIGTVFQPHRVGEAAILDIKDVDPLTPARLDSKVLPFKRHVMIQFELTTIPSNEIVRGSSFAFIRHRSEMEQDTVWVEYPAEKPQFAKVLDGTPTAKGVLAWLPFLTLVSLLGITLWARRKSPRVKKFLSFPARRARSSITSRAS